MRNPVLYDPTLNRLGVDPDFFGKKFLGIAVGTKSGPQAVIHLATLLARRNSWRGRIDADWGHTILANVPTCHATPDKQSPTQRHATQWRA
jgi:hypothetical protein